MVWCNLVQKWAKLFNSQCIDLVLFVDQSFEVFHLGGTIKYGAKLVSSQTTVVEQETVYDFIVQEFTGICKTLHMTILQRIVLQT